MVRKKSRFYDSGEIFWAIQICLRVSDQDLGCESHTNARMDDFT